MVLIPIETNVRICIHDLSLSSVSMERGRWINTQCFHSIRVSDWFVLYQCATMFPKMSGALLIRCFHFNVIQTQTPTYLTNIFIVDGKHTGAEIDSNTLMVKWVQLSSDELSLHCASRLWNSIRFFSVRNKKLSNQWNFFWWDQRICNIKNVIYTFIVSISISIFLIYYSHDIRCFCL